MQLIAQLKDKVFRWFPSSPPAFESKTSKSGGSWAVRYGYADYKEVSFQSEEGVRIRAQLLTPKQGASRAPLLVYVKRATDSFYSSDMDELLPLLREYQGFA